jgi:hypothetical protein
LIVKQHGDLGDYLATFNSNDSTRFIFSLQERVTTTQERLRFQMEVTTQEQKEEMVIVCIFLVYLRCIAVSSNNITFKNLACSRSR